MKQIKKLLALLLCLCMVWSAISVGAVSDIEIQADMELGTRYLVTLSSGNKAYFSFTPETDGKYYFTSVSHSDTFGVLYNSNMEALFSDDDSGENNNFSITYDFSAGTTYILSAAFLSNSVEGSFEVYINEVPVVSSIVFNDISLIKEMDGYWTNDDYSEEFFYYYWNNALTYTVTMQNGDTFEAKGEFFSYNSATYSIDLSDTQYETHWTSGNTYTVEVSFNDILSEISVTICDTPIASIEFSPISIIENTGGSESSRYDSETGEYVKYYRYSWENELKYTIYFNGDEEPVTSNGQYFTYNGTEYRFNCSDTQYDTPWTQEGNNKAFLSVLGYTAEISVDIVDSPIEKIEFKPISIIENTNGYIDSYYDDEKETVVSFYRYSWSDFVDYTVTFTDGTTQDSTSSRITYKDKSYYLSFQDDQFTTNWTVGNTYTPTVSVLGIETTVNVTITPSPIANIEVKPITTIVGNNGYTNSDYDSETDTFTDWYYYRWDRMLEYTVTFADGETLQVNSTHFEYDGNSYSLDCYDTQHETHWMPGNTYTGTISVAGYSADVSVTIEQSPILKIDFEPITVVENVNGYIDTCYNDYTGEDEEFFRYEWYGDMKFTITFRDGTTYSNDDGGNNFEYNGKYYYLNNDDDQNSEHWYVGNTYYPSVNALGYRTEVSVTVIKLPIEAELELDTKYTANFPNGGKLFFEFIPEESGNYAFTSYSNDDTCARLYDEDMNELQYDDDGGEENNFLLTYILEKGKRYIYSARFLSSGDTGSFDVMLYKLPTVTSITVDPIVMIENGNGYYNESYDYETNEYAEWFYYDWQSDISYTITFDDKSTCKGNGGSFEYKGQTYNLTFYDHQHEEHWYVGNTYYPKVSALGFETNATVSVIKTPIKSITFNPVFMSIDDYYEDYYYNSETDEFIYYNYYDWRDKLTYTVTFIDDTTITVNGYSGVEFGGNYYHPQFTDSQTPFNPWGEGTYTENITLMNFTAPFEINIFAPTEKDGYKFIETDSGITILGCTLETEALVVPSTINGKPVIAIDSLYPAIENVTELAIPDSVTTVSNNLLHYANSLKKIHIGTGLDDLGEYMQLFYYEDTLTEITVSADNPSYTSVDGVLYDKDISELLVYPSCRTGVYNIPATVINIERLISDLYYLPKVKVEFPKINNTGYVKVDGIIYSEDMTLVVDCDYDRIGAYEMPDTVTDIRSTALAETGLTSVIVSNNVTDIVYFAFGGSSGLESIILPDKLESIESMAFYNTGLTSIVIPETVTFISGDAFKDTPLFENAPEGAVYIDKCLYSFKGEADENTELAIKEGTTILAAYALYNQSNITKLIIPESLHTICYKALAMCHNIESIVIDENNENFYLEDGILYDKNDEVVWAPLTNIDFRYYGMTALSYGEEIDIGHFNLRYCYADGDYENFWTEELQISGFVPYYVGTQTVTVSYAGFSEKFEFEVMYPDYALSSGDLSGDGVIDIIDLVSLRQILVLFDTNIKNNGMCDANEDGYIDIRDLVNIKKQIAASDDIIDAPEISDSVATG